MNEEINKVKQLLSTGKDCRKIEEYRKHYETITGKKYTSGCGNCACRYLFAWLDSYIKNNKL